MQHMLSPCSTLDTFPIAQLYGNPLEYLPELAPAVGLRSLSLANVRILADTAYSRWAMLTSCGSAHGEVA
jgi:hypothetical protein